MRPAVIGIRTRRPSWRVALLAKRIGERMGIHESMHAVAPYDKAMRNSEKRGNTSIIKIALL